MGRQEGGRWGQAPTLHLLTYFLTPCIRKQLVTKGLQPDQHAFRLGKVLSFALCSQIKLLEEAVCIP